MSRDGSGNYSLPEAAFVYDTVIDEAAVNNNFSDIASALTASLAKDGQTNPTANLPMATYRHTGVGNASARTDYAAAGQVQDSAFIWCGTAGGSKNALTLTPSPAITAYATGQKFRFKAGSTASDDAITIAVSGLTAKAGEMDDAAFSASVVIEANKYYEALYDGTAFQVTRLSFNPDEHASPTTTRGDLIRRGASADERVALGADNTLLTSDGTDPGWETVTSLLDAALSSTQGVILYRGSSAWAALAVGTAGQLLETQGAGANPAWATPPLSASYTSSGQTITSAGTLTLAHGLGAIPKIVQARLVCGTTDLGYSVSDEVCIDFGPLANDTSRGVSVVPDATNLNIRFGSDSSAFSLLNKGTGGVGNITNSSWTIKFLAFV